ncbi:MAG TPA: hypothetical protein ENO18_00580 [Caldithrix sp.]|nr:hypothetical protein [Caldithrix sp.]
MPKENDNNKKPDISCVLYEIHGLARLLELAVRDLEGSFPGVNVDVEYSDPFSTAAAVIQQKAQYCIDELEKLEVEINHKSNMPCV